MLNLNNKINNQEGNSIVGSKTKKKRSIFIVVLRVLLVIIFIYIISKNNTSYWEQEANNIYERINNKDTKSNSDVETTKEENNFIKNTYLNKIDRTDDAKRKANLADIRIALEGYYLVNGSYPKADTSTKPNDENSLVYKELSKFTSADNLKDPKDPEFYYLYRSDGTSFELNARLENGKGSECDPSSSADICIYKVSSNPSR